MTLFIGGSSCDVFVRKRKISSFSGQFDGDDDWIVTPGGNMQ
jgi:hypothetical protein